jgi:hypothetical protein
MRALVRGEVVGTGSTAPQVTRRASSRKIDLDGIMFRFLLPPNSAERMAIDASGDQPTYRSCFSVPVVLKSISCGEFQPDRHGGQPSSDSDSQNPRSTDSRQDDHELVKLFFVQVLTSSLPTEEGLCHRETDRRFASPGTSSSAPWSAVLLFPARVGAAETADDFIALICGGEQPLFDAVVAELCRCCRRAAILTADRSHRAGRFIPRSGRLAR